MTVVKLCRFSILNGTEPELVFEDADITAVNYLTISHVWGPPNLQSFRKLENINTSQIRYQDQRNNGKVLSTTHKANFLSKHLLPLVQEQLFWMDILCVDQGDEKARIAIVDLIPQIYTHSSQLIAIRDGDGPRTCCVEAMGDLTQWNESGVPKFFEHARKEHFLKANLDESYVQRLWPLQELQLSKNVRFAACESWDIPPNTDDLNETTISAIRFVDHMKALAALWFSESLYEGPSVTKFVTAFLTCGSVSRDQDVITSRMISPAQDVALKAEINSMRTTSKERDFILAVMPQYAWWRSPADKTAMKSWEFVKLFNYTFDLAKEGDCGFLGKFTRSMVEDPSLLDKEAAWTKSEQLPSPTNLGDFYKLLGSSSCSLSTLSSRHGILMNRVKAYNFTSAIGFEMAVKLISKCMEFNKYDWSLAFNGELSMYGTVPSDRWKSAIPSPYSTDEIYRDCVAALGALWSTLGLQIKVQASVIEDWNEYKAKMTRENPQFYKATMLTLAAMVECGIGVSALTWVSERFFPILVQICEGRLVLGLLSKIYVHTKMTDARDDAERRQWMNSAIEFECLQRLSGDGGWTGSDLVLLPVKEDAEKMGRVPVGLVSRLPSERVEEAEFQRDIFMSYRHEKSINDQGQTVVTKVPDVYV